MQLLINLMNSMRSVILCFILLFLSFQIRKPDHISCVSTTLCYQFVVKVGLMTCRRYEEDKFEIVDRKSVLHKTYFH